MGRPQAHYARTAALSPYVLEADLGVHGCKGGACPQSEVHLGWRASLLFDMGRYLAMGLHVAHLVDHDVGIESDSKKLNWDLTGGFELRVRIPLRRFMFWGSVMTGIGARYHLYEYESAGTQVKHNASLMNNGGVGLGVDVHLTPRVSIGLSSWIYGALYWGIARRHQYSYDDYRESILTAFHWTASAGVRIYLGRQKR